MDLNVLLVHVHSHVTFASIHYYVVVPLVISQFR